MKFPNEMKKLRTMLTEMGIRWADTRMLKSMGCTGNTKDCLVARTEYKGAVLYGKETS